MVHTVRFITTFIFAVTLMYHLLDCKKNLQENIYLVCLYSAALVLIDGFLLFKLGAPTFLKLYPLLVHIPVLLAFLYLSNFSALKVFFIHWTLVAISISISMTGLIISYFMNYSKTVMNLVCFILYVPFWIVMYRYVRPPFLYMMRNTNKGWLGFSVIPISFSIAVYTSDKYNLNVIDMRPPIKDIIILFILIVSSYVLIIQYFQITKKQLTLQNEQTLLRTQVDASKHYIEALAESQEKAILYRHDMRHHLALIHSYLADNNLDTAQLYISSVEKAIQDTQIKKHCNNYSVNLILSSYLTKAKQEQIAVETQINLPENNLISDMDLCIIFSNALENAITACRSVFLQDNRMIRIISHIKNNKLFIEITNSYEGKITFENDMPVSPFENHGFGTKSIVAVVQKYDGLCSFLAKDKVFEVRIIL